MWNIPDERQLYEVPKMYETESIPPEEKIVHLHFFIGGCDWYVCEYDGVDTFFGYAILNSNYLNAEWGYVNFDELQSVKIGFMEIDCDLFWNKRPAKEVDKIAKRCGWEVP